MNKPVHIEPHQRKTDEDNVPRLASGLLAGEGAVAGEEEAGRAHFRCTCSCTSAAPSSWRRGCASPGAAGGCSAPRWGGAAGSARWRIGQRSHRKPEENQHENMILDLSSLLRLLNHQKRTKLKVIWCFLLFKLKQTETTCFFMWVVLMSNLLILFHIILNIWGSIQNTMEDNYFWVKKKLYMSMYAYWDNVNKDTPAIQNILIMSVCLYVRFLLWSKLVRQTESVWFDVV